MSKIDEVMKAWQEEHQKVSWQDLQILKAENEALRAQIGQGEPVGTAISYYTEDGHTKWTFQPTKLGWEMPQDSRANERGARSCFDVYAHSAQQASVVAFCTYPKCQTTGMKCVGQCSQAAVMQQGPVMIYHGDCTIDCGEHGHHHVELLKMIPAGSHLYTRPAPQQKPLLFSEIWDNDAIMEVNADARLPFEMIERFVRAIEAAATEPLLQRIAELERQLEEARKDAERYRWLKEHRVDDVDPDGIAGAIYKDLYFRWYSPIGDKGVRQQPVDIDNAIDAAMQKDQS